MTKAVILFGLLFATPALADWQYTNWDMTPEQVVAASSGNVKIDPGQAGVQIQRYKHGASGTHPSRDGSFVVHFYFERDSDRLRMVNLQIDNHGDTCKSIARELVDALGKPAETDDVLSVHQDTWNDESKNNRVSFSTIGRPSAPETCIIIYAPLVSEPSKGP